MAVTKPIASGTLVLGTPPEPGDNTAKVATMEAVQDLVTERISSAFIYRGSTDCSTNPNYPAATAGHLYRVSVAGKIGGSSGVNVGVGDFYVALVDNAGGTEAAVGTSWEAWEGNLQPGVDYNNYRAEVDKLGVQGAPLASASSVDIGAATGEFVTISGNTTVTSFGTADAGINRVLVFSGTPTLTHNATSLILPTGANIVCAVGDVAVMRSLGSGNWRCVDFVRASGAALASAGGGSLAFPKTLFISASLGDNDTAVIGDPSKPFLTSQAAFDAWLDLVGSPGHIHVIDGNGGGIIVTADMLHDLHVTGAGLWCNLGGIFADGAWGADGGDDENGGPGSPGWALRITSDKTVNLGFITAQGGQGGQGGPNLNNETDGGEGAQGGNVKLFNVLCAGFVNNGGGGGNPSEYGNPGAGGKPGNATLIDVHVQANGLSIQEAFGATTPDVTVNLLRCVVDAGALNVSALNGVVAFCAASSISVTGGATEHSNIVLTHAPTWP